jgi:anterior pharynx defective protein 1
LLLDYRGFVDFELIGVKMGYPLVIGCFLIAFSPALAIMYFLTKQSAQLVILTIGSSFFWLLSILLVAIWWFIIPPLRESFWWIIPWSVLIQEGVRLLFYKLYVKGESGFVASAPTSQLTTHPDELRASLALGLGSGIAYSLITYVSILWSGIGPGTYYSDTCPSVNIFIISALFSMVFILFHALWAVVAFEGFKTKKYFRVGIVVGCHLLVSLLTLLNFVHCAASLVLLFLILFGFTCYTYYTVIYRQKPTLRFTQLREDQ